MGLKKSKLQGTEKSKSFILLCRTEKLHTAAPLCRFSILLHRTEKAIPQRTRRAQAIEPSAGPLFSSLWLNKSKLQIHLQVLNLLRRTEKGPHCRGLEKVQTAKPSASLLFPSVKLEKLKLHLLKELTTSHLVKLLFVTTRHK